MGQVTQFFKAAAYGGPSLSPAQVMAQLTVVRMRARFLRTLERLRSPRRLAISVLAAVTAVVWTGQLVAGIFLRERADPAQLALWIPLCLTGYAIWHVLKVSFRKPVEPFEWTASEREWLIGAPIRRADLVKYRFRTIVISAFFKSSVFALAMIPDLSILPLGLIGTLGGLLFIDLIRIALEVFVYGLSYKERIALRCVNGSLALLAVVYAVTWAVTHSDVGLSLASAASLGFLIKIGLGLVALAHTWSGALLMLPFQLFSDIVVADSLSMALLWNVALAGGIVWACYRGLVALDRHWRKRRVDREVSQFDQIRSANKHRLRANAAIQRLERPVRLGGAGPLAWQQLLSARKYEGSLIAALSVPLVLSCLPALSELTGLAMVNNVVAGLAFYSFLLLPAAFKFDFRRDVNRMTVLKSLPFSPSKIVIGQLAAPVLLTFLFQAVVLLATHLINPYQPILFVVSLAVLLPFNVFIFGFENLLFIWFPHRLQEEGLQVFVRTILAFTGKGILFALAIAVTLAWDFYARSLATYWVPDAIQRGVSMIFCVGMWTTMMLVAAFVLAALTGAFKRFDPSCDLAGVA